MDIATTRPAHLERLRSLDPFDPAAESSARPMRKAQRREPLARHPIDVGCVDWYLYPVNRKPRRTER